jgi:hypothetical protein
VTGGPQKDIIEPIWEYHHSVGVCIIGGSAYRGCRKRMGRTPTTGRKPTLITLQKKSGRCATTKTPSVSLPTGPFELPASPFCRSAKTSRVRSISLRTR